MLGTKPERVLVGSGSGEWQAIGPMSLLCRRKGNQLASRQDSRLLAYNSWPLIQLVSTGIFLVYQTEEFIGYKPTHQRLTICALERQGRKGDPYEPPPALDTAERTRSMRKGRREDGKRAGNKLQ